MSEFPTLQDLVWAAREKLPRPVWDFVTFGSESETTLRRNRRALDSLAFVPRIMQDVSEVDPTSELLGLKLRIPVLLAPLGSVALLDPAGAVAVATTAQSFGTVQIVSGFAAPGYEAVAKACPGPCSTHFTRAQSSPFSTISSTALWRPATRRSCSSAKHPTIAAASAT